MNRRRSEHSWINTVYVYGTDMQLLPGYDAAIRRYMSADDLKLLEYTVGAQVDFVTSLALSSPSSFLSALLEANSRALPREA